MCKEWQGSRKLSQAHEKVCDEKEEKWYEHKNAIDGTKSTYQYTYESNLDGLQVWSQ